MGGRHKDRAPLSVQGCDVEAKLDLYLGQRQWPGIPGDRFLSIFGILAHKEHQNYPWISYRTWICSGEYVWRATFAILSTRCCDRSCNDCAQLLLTKPSPPPGTTNSISWESTFSCRRRQVGAFKSLIGCNLRPDSRLGRDENSSKSTSCGRAIR